MARKRSTTAVVKSACAAAVSAARVRVSASRSSVNTDSEGGVATRRAEDSLVSRRISSAIPAATTRTTMSVDTQGGTPGTMLSTSKSPLSQLQSRSHRS